MKKICSIVFVTFLFFFIHLNDVKAEQYENIDIVTVANYYINEYFDCSYHLKNYEYIYDLDNNRYYLIHVDPIGYMIIDKDTFNLQEASVSMNSPYSEYDSSDLKIYLGPTNYYIYDNNQLINVHTKHEITIDSELNNTLSLLENNFTTINEMQTMSIGGDGGEDDDRTYDTNGFTLIPNAQYMKNLTFYPDNRNGTCGYVSLSILLGYLNTFYNPYTIPGGAITHIRPDGSSETSTGFITSAPKNYTLNLPNDLSIYDWATMPGTTNIIHDILQDYEHYLLQTSNGYAVASNQFEDTFLDYRNDYIPSEYQNHYEIVNIPFSSLQNKKNKAKELIDEGTPVVLSLTNYDYTTNIGAGNGNLQEAHNVIAYGYKNDMFLTHFGWKGEANYREVILNSYSIYSVFAITYISEHIHNDFFEWKTIYGNGTYCSCGYLNCSHPSNNFVQNNNENHHVVCKICGYSKTENHEFVVGETTMICNRCGFEKSLPCSHNYIYNNYYDKIGHQMKCTICGDIKKESHKCISLQGVYSCTICPYENKNIVIGPTSLFLKKEENDEE